MVDEPITDIKFVSSIDNCPEGYNIMTNCPCGHDAQLWEKIIGGESGTRYICFTRDKKADTVIEDLYIPSKGQQYLRRGYHIIKETIEGDTPMYHRQLAVKSVPRSEARKPIAEIIVARSKDKISTIYKKTEKVNGLCICFRTMDYTYVLPPALAARRSTLSGGEKVQKRFEQTLNYVSGTADGGRDLGKQFEGMRVYDEKQPSERARSGSDVTATGRQFKVSLTSYAPSPPSSPRVIDGDPLPPYSEAVDPQTYKVNLRDYRPSPAFTEKQEKPTFYAEAVSSDFVYGIPPKYPDKTTPTAPVICGEVATASVSHALGSAPPPAPVETPPTQLENPAYSSSSSPYPPPGPTATSTAGTTTYNNPNPISSYQPSPGIMQSYPPQQFHSYPPPPPPQSSSNLSPAPGPSAPHGGVGYAPVQSGAYQPQPLQYQPTTSTEAPPSYNTSIGFQVGVAMGGASYAPPPPPGYQVVAGSAFGQSGFSSVGQGPAPYNPYQHHQQTTGGYPPPPPPGATHNQSTNNYGFNF